MHSTLQHEHIHGASVARYSRPTIFSFSSSAAAVVAAAAGSCVAAALVAFEAPETTFAFPPGLVAPSAYFSCSVTHFVCNCTVYRSNSSPQSTQLNREAEQLLKCFFNAGFLIESPQSSHTNHTIVSFMMHLSLFEEVGNTQKLFRCCCVLIRIQLLRACVCYISSII